MKKNVRLEIWKNFLNIQLEIKEYPDEEREWFDNKKMVYRNIVSSISENNVI